jgi:hypothetical protein
LVVHTDGQIDEQLAVGDPGVAWAGGRHVAAGRRRTGTTRRRCA